jgi:hypothetical protein
MRKFTLILMMILFSVTLAFSAQLSEGFESWPPTNWTIIQGPCSPTNDITQSSTYAYSGTYSARFSSWTFCGSGYDEYLITPELVTTSGDQTISFWYRRYSSGSETFRVGWSSIGTNVSTDFTWTADITDASTTWQQYSKTDLPIGTKYVAIHYKSDYAYYLYVDDVAGPEVYAPPHNFATLDNAADSRSMQDTTVSGGSSVIFQIVAKNLGTTTESSAIKWTCTGGTPTSDTDESTGSLAQDATEHHVFSPTWTAPSISGTYTVKFFTDLAGDSDRSNDTTEVIITVCAPQTPPYTESFDGVTAPVIPDCWTVENTNNDSYEWVTSTSYARSSPNCMYMRYSSNEAMDDWFFSCPFNLIGGTAYWVSFWYRGGNASYPEKLEVYACNGPSSADTLTGEQIFNDDNILTTDYIKGRGTFTPASSGNYYIGWHGYSDINQYYIYVDDVTIEEAPTTPLFSIDPDSAGFGIISLKDTSNVQLFTVKNAGIGTLTISSVSVTGTDVDQFVLADTNSYPIDLGEDESIAFDVSFAPTSEGDKSAQITIIDNVTTTTNIPLTGEGVIFFEDFEDYSSDPSSIEWYGANDKEIFNPGGVELSHMYDGEWRSDDFGNEPDLTKSARFNYFSTTANDSDLLVTPVIDLTANSGENILEFDIALTLYTGTTDTTMDDNDTLYVVVSENGAIGTLAEFTRDGIVATFTNSTPISNTGDHIVIDLVSFGSRGSVQIAFYGKDPSKEEAADYNLYIDNVKVTKNPASAIEIDDVNKIPEVFILSQNYPNPFNPVTTISYALPKASDITIEIFNILGQKVKTLINASNQKAGAYNVVWNGKDQFGNQVSSGIYFYRIQAGNFIQAKKMVLMK